MTTLNGFEQRLYATTELAKKKLSVAQGKMKRLYDRKKETWEFLPGDQVLASLPVIAHRSKQNSRGPSTVLKKRSEQNYMIATAEKTTPAMSCEPSQTLLSPGTSRRWWESLGGRCSSNLSSSTFVISKDVTTLWRMHYPEHLAIKIILLLFVHLT